MKKCDFTSKVQENAVSVWLFAVCSFLFGVIVGFCFAPVKKGIKVGNNNGNTVKYIGPEDEDEDE